MKYFPLRIFIQMPQGRGYSIKQLTDIFAEQDEGISIFSPEGQGREHDKEEDLDFLERNADRVFVIPQPYKARSSEISDAQIATLGLCA